MNTRVRILNLEDNALDSQLIQSMLEDKGIACELTRVETEAAYQQALERGGFDLIISDYNLPSFDGVRGLVLARQLRPDTPFIFFSGAIGEDTAVKSLHSGATDYVLKQRSQRLPSAVQRALQEAELQRQRRQSDMDRHSLLSNIPGMVYRSNADWSCEIYRGCREICGYTPEELAAEPETWLGLIHPEDVERVVAESAEMQNKPTALLQTYRIRAQDGSIRWVEDRRVSRFNSAQAFAGVDGVVFDITARKQAEMELRRLVQVIAQSSDSIIITDIKGAILYVNSTFERVSGYSRQEALGQNPRLLQSGRHDAAFYQHLWATLTRGQTWRGQFCNKRKDGSLYEEEASISPVCDSQGATTGYASAKRDVTHERSLARQLEQAQKMETLGHLAGGVAHDFNNLIQAITGFGEMVLATFDQQDERREDLGQILAAARRAQGLTRQLLSFSRKQVIEPQHLKVNKVLQGTEKMLHRLLGENIKLTTQLDSDVAPIMADPGQLEQAVLNLVVNARDAMPKGGTITISSANCVLDAAEAEQILEARAGRFVTVAVTDTGTGISPEILPHLFEPFFTTKGEGKGTGLGLAVVYGATKQNGGWVQVASHVGRGTTFTLYLPALDEAAAPADHAAAAQPVPQTRGRGERILLAEDDETVRDLIRRTLILGGYAVETAASAPEALRISNQTQGGFDLLVTDMIMPGQDGLELALELRARQPRLRVILISGYADERARWDDIQARGLRFLQKPFTQGEMLSFVRKVLEDDPASASQEAS